MTTNEYSRSQQSAEDIFIRARDETAQTLASVGEPKETALFDAIDRRWKTCCKDSKKAYADSLSEFSKKALTDLDRYAKITANGRENADGFLLIYIINTLRKQEEEFDRVFEQLSYSIHPCIMHIVYKNVQQKPYNFDQMIQILESVCDSDGSKANYELSLVPKIRLRSRKLPSESADVQEIHSDIALAGTHIQTMKNSIELCAIPETVEGALRDLGLSNHKQITISEVMKVSRKATPSSQEEISLIDLPFAIIQRIMMMDFHGRDNIFQRVKTTSKNVIGSGQRRRFAEKKGKPLINPLDVFLLTYSHCHPLLQQALYAKMFACKLAVPFLYQTAAGKYCLCLWALRAIILDPIPGDGAGQLSAVNCFFQTISAVRIGASKVSKSKLLNSILYNDEHATFFHRDCTWGKSSKTIANGMVEAAWYLPSDKDGNDARGRMMILNLRGDGMSYECTVKYLSHISNMLLIVLDTKELGDSKVTDLLKTVIPMCKKLVVLLVSSEEKVDLDWIDGKLDGVEKELGEDACKSFEWEYGFSENDGEAKTISDIKSALHPKLREDPNDIQRTLSKLIETGSSKFGFDVDEDCTVIQESKSKAESVFKHAEGSDLMRVRTYMLFLQDIPWKNLSKFKKMALVETDSTERSNLERQALAERYNQLILLADQSDEYRAFYQAFQDCLMNYSCLKDIEGMSFFMQWMKLLLDENTRKHPPRKSIKHTLDIMKLLREEEGKAKPCEDTLTRLRKEAKEINDEIYKSSLGLEHLLREMAQVYEAVVEHKADGISNESYKRSYEALPLAAAQLLLNGNPLELMDGESENVPLSWIKAVLKHAKELEGDKRLLIISVLGIQSSGKSTMLNAMFGLQFAVSAGRTTRGIYMQLVPVEESADCPFDYVLVLDTEGLRTLESEQDDLHHDNLLATLVIGLGDITIVNIYGEDSSEMRNTLEVAASAFLKMQLGNKSLKLQQSCVFVHQNVSASDAEDKLRTSYETLLNFLNKATKQAAERLKIPQIDSFNQVINCEGQKHVRYFSGLWKGDPPMAHANPGYTWCVSELKSYVMECTNDSNTLYRSFEGLASHVSDLYTAICSEDFLFSYRNSSEINAMHRIGQEVCALRIKMGEKVDEWLNKATVKLSECTNENMLDTIFNSLLVQNGETFKDLQYSIHQELNTFFDSNEIRYVPRHWRADRKHATLATLRSMIAQFDADAKSRLEEKRDLKLLEINELLDEKSRFKKFLVTARNLAEGFKDGAPSPEVMKEEFEKQWNVWKCMYIDKEPRPEKAIHQQIELLLLELMPGHRELVQEVCRRKPINRPSDTRKLRYSPENLPELQLREINSDANLIRIRKFFKLFWSSQGSDRSNQNKIEARKQKCRTNCLNFINTTLANIEGNLVLECESSSRFDSKHALNILQGLVTRIEEQNDSLKHDEYSEECAYSMSKDFEAEVLVFVARFMNHKYGKMQQDYESCCSFKARLLRFHDRAYSIFKSTIQQTATEVRAACLFNVIITQWLKERTAEKMQEIVKITVTKDFHGEKYILLKRILIDLADCNGDNGNQFLNYTFYIDNPLTYALSWITRHITKKYFEAPTVDALTLFQQSYMQEAKCLLTLINQSAERASVTVSGQKHTGHVTPMQVWVKEFCDHIRKNDRMIKESDFEELLESYAMEFSFHEFKKYIIESSSDLEMRDTVFRHGSADAKTTIIVSPMLESLWGCTAQCPFCKEPCRLVLNHEGGHMCIQHKPQGVTGQLWIRAKGLVTENCNTILRSKAQFVCLHRSWHEAYKESMQADLVFLVDVTGSMKPYILGIWEHINSMIQTLKDRQPDLKVNLAFVGYRDYNERVLILKFTDDVAKFKNFVMGIEAKGGGLDRPEDVLSGLAAVVRLNWTSTHRFLMHFADAPCHGRDFHNLLLDFNSNLYSRDGGLHIGTLMKSLVDIDVFYVFGKINNSTDKMIAAFNNAIQTPEFIKTYPIYSVHTLSVMVPETVTATICSRKTFFRKAMSEHVPIPGDKCAEPMHLYKDYKKCVSDWEIDPEMYSNTSDYWKRFMYRFQDDLRSHYQAEMIVDPDWESIDYESAIKSLDNLRP